MWAQSGQIWQTSANFDLFGPNLGRLRPTLGQFPTISANFGRSRPIYAKLGPNGKSGQQSANLQQISAELGPTSTNTLDVDVGSMPHVRRKDEYAGTLLEDFCVYSGLTAHRTRIGGAVNSGGQPWRSTQAIDSVGSQSECRSIPAACVRDRLNPARLKRFSTKFGLLATKLGRLLPKGQARSHRLRAGLLSTDLGLTSIFRRSGHTCGGFEATWPSELVQPADEVRREGSDSAIHCPGRRLRRVVCWLGWTSS